MLKYIHKKSQDRIEKILELYREGKTLTNIGEQVGTHRDVVKRHLIQAGVDYDGDQKKLQEEKKVQVIKYYEEGKSQVWIEQNLKMTRKTIREILKETDVHYKSKSEQWRIRHGNTLDETVFDTITPESAYWIGMLYTDGHISSGERGYNIELMLHKSDEEHLEKYLLFLKSSNKIEQSTRKKMEQMVRVRVGSEKLHRKLQEYGMSNRKSWDAIPPEKLQNNRDFWRGCVDGDGGIYCKGVGNYATHQVFFCGTLDMVCGFIWFCQDNSSIINRKYPSKCKKAVCLYQVSYYGEEAKMIASMLYKDTATHLDRKYEKYLEITGQKEISSEKLADMIENTDLSSELTNNLCHK